MASSSSPTPIESKRSGDAEVPDEDEEFVAPVLETKELESGSKESKKPKRGGTARRWFKRLLGLLVLGGLAVGGYFAWPTINDRFVEPVEEAAADLDDVQERTSELGSASEDLTSRTANLEERLGEVESAQATTSERLDDLDQLITDQTTRLDDLDELSNALGDDLAATNAEAARRLDLTRTAELMSRARLFLFQANYGLAAADLDAARTTLINLDTSTEDDALSTVDIEEVIDRLDRSIANLPDRPVSASSDLDIAWQALLQPEQPDVLPFIESDDVDSDESTDEDAEATTDEDASDETPDESVGEPAN